jgi:HK97 gp10 family phage protein
MIPVVAEIKGLRELERDLKILRESFGVKTGGVILRGLSAGAKLIVKDAKRRAPKRDPSGLLVERQARARAQGKTKGRRQRGDIGRSFALIRNNIVQYKVAADRPTVVVRVRNAGHTRVNGKIRFLRPGTSPGYWWWVEFGTSKMPARPFLRPAFESQKLAAVLEMRRHMQDEIARHFGNAFKRAA